MRRYKERNPDEDLLRLSVLSFLPFSIFFQLHFSCKTHRFCQVHLRFVTISIYIFHSFSYLCVFANPIRAVFFLYLICSLHVFLSKMFSFMSITKKLWYIYIFAYQNIILISFSWVFFNYFFMLWKLSWGVQELGWRDRFCIWVFSFCALKIYSWNDGNVFLGIFCCENWARC